MRQSGKDLPKDFHSRGHYSQNLPQEQTAGFYSKLSVSDSQVIKTISCNKSGMSWPEAENLREHILYYKSQLDQLKIPNPKLISCKIKEIHNNRHLLILEEEKIVGNTVSELAKDVKVDNLRFLGFCRKILKYYSRTIAVGRRISLDPPLSNFILGINHKGIKNIYYVDSMPPRQQTINRWVVEYPGPQSLELQNYHHKRHFTDSQFQVIFVQMCKERISIRKKLANLFKEVFTRDVLNHISIPKNLSSIFNLLNSAKIYDIDYLRNLSLELLYRKIISQSEFKKIYEQTHIQEGTGDIPSTKELTNLNLFLLNKLKKNNHD